MPDRSREPAGPAGTDPVQPDRALLQAAYDADVSRLAAALEDGADVNAADPETGLTALHIAVGMNNLPMVQVLVEDYQAAFTTDRRGRWPTVIAAQCRTGDALSDYIVEQEAAFLRRQESA